MEFINGIELNVLFNEKIKLATTLDEKVEAKKILFEVLKQGVIGLRSLNEAKIVHRDIKGDNIFLDLSKDPIYMSLKDKDDYDVKTHFTSKTIFTLKLGDFGVSKSLESV